MTSVMSSCGGLQSLVRVRAAGRHLELCRPEAQRLGPQRPFDERAPVRRRNELTSGCSDAYGMTVSRTAPPSSS